MLNYRYNKFIFLRTLLGTLQHVEWQSAYARFGLWGIVRAFFGGLLGLNAWPIYVHADGEWTPERLDDLLRTRGIAGWGWGYHGGEFYFRVKLRQAQWAQHVLLQAGVPLRGKLLAGGVGSPYGQSPRHGQAVAQPTHPASRQPVGGPLDAIDRVVDKLAGL